MRKIKKLLKNSNLILAKELSDLLSHSDAILDNYGDNQIPYETLLLGYKERAKGIEKSNTPYAKQLLKFTKEFITNLEQHRSEGGKWYSISTHTEYGYFLFVSDVGVPLGCIKSISKEDVSHKRWTELWGNKV